MCDVRLNDKHTSEINLEGPSLIRRSRKVLDPPKKWSNCANGWLPLGAGFYNDIYKKQGKLYILLMAYKTIAKTN